MNERAAGPAYQVRFVLTLTTLPTIRGFTGLELYVTIPGMNTQKNGRGIPVTELIKKRKSVRTYTLRPLAAEVRQSIESYCSRVRGPFKSAVRVQFLDKPSIRAEQGIKLGNYGVIVGARSFISAAISRDRASLLQLGYVLEDIVLFLTSQGLGTCWLGASFTRHTFAAAMRLRANEILPIVISLGYPAVIRAPVDLLIKPLPFLKARKKWSSLFFDQALESTLTAQQAGDYALPLEMLRLAPSASNKQPWRILRKNQTYHFYLAHDAVYAKRYLYDIQKIDMGIALFHFESSCAEAGLKGSWAAQNPGIPDLPSHYEYIMSWETKL